MDYKKKPKLGGKNKDRIKYEIAKELGLLDKVIQGGWGSLSTKETGRIGGLVTARRKNEKMKATGEKKPPI